MRGNVIVDLTILDYRELAVRYDLVTLKVGGDLSIGPDGEFETTVDGDLKLGSDQHNALHRLVVRWQMEVPTHASAFESVLGSEQKKKSYDEMISALAQSPSLDKDSAAEWHELQQIIAIHEDGPGITAGGIAVAFNNLLKREWVDLGKPRTWDSAGTLIAGHSFGSVMEAASNNFRHADEWAQSATPTPQQLKSIKVIADVFGHKLAEDGARHPFRGNVCPKLLLIVSDGNFEKLMDRLFNFARSLAGL